ncbi:MAG: LysE family translocator [Burkholderiaceae bacterium]
MEAGAWLIFVASSLALITVPGQDMVLVMSRSLAAGPRAGVATAAGVSVGLVGHSVLAALGLGALLRASEWLFTGIKLAGAAYLAWLGIGLLRAGATHLALSTGTVRSLRRSFADGAVSNLGNPKIAVFYFAYLPQFVPADTSHPALAVLALGIVFAALTFVVKGPVGLSAGLLSGWLRARPAALAWIYRASGLVMIGLGMRLLFERRD